ncbi:MAG TPA: hypothetical protein VJ302_09155, partial [Blastocatellia bacterium]|nr:hypothetical protein [Blastocatellia bacterium]
MQRMLIYVVLLALAVFGATASALMKEDLRPQLSRGHGPAPKPSSTEVLPQAYLNQSRFHKMIVSQREAAVYRELKRLKAVREEVNYGDFKLLIVDEGMLGGRESVRALQVSPRDDQNLIVLNDYLIDTS